MVSGLKFNPLNSSWVCFCIWYEKIFLTSLLYTQLSTFPGMTYWKDCLFSIVYSCRLCHGLIDHRCMGLFLVFLLCLIDLCVYSCASTMPFSLLRLCIILSRGVWYLQLCSFILKTVLTICSLLWLHMGFPGGLDGKQSTCNVRDWVWSLGWEDPYKFLGSFILLLWKMSWVFW